MCVCAWPSGGTQTHHDVRVEEEGEESEAQAEEEEDDEDDNEDGSDSGEHSCDRSDGEASIAATADGSFTLLVRAGKPLRLSAVRVGEMAAPAGVVPAGPSPG